MENELLGIGRLASLSGLPVSALRFYDGAGVLRPTMVDPASGYRFYQPNQVISARLVAHLRRVGLPLDDIRTVRPNRPRPRRSWPPTSADWKQAWLTPAERSPSFINYSRTRRSL